MGITNLLVRTDHPRVIFVSTSYRYNKTLKVPTSVPAKPGGLMQLHQSRLVKLKVLLMHRRHLPPSIHTLTSVWLNPRLTYNVGMPLDKRKKKRQF
jgi:hypothetical protein